MNAQDLSDILWIQLAFDLSFMIAIYVLFQRTKR